MWSSDEQGNRNRFFREGLIVAILKPNPNKTAGAPPIVTMPPFSFGPNEALVEMIVQAWTDPDFQNQLSCDTDIAADETPYFVIPIGSPANSKKRGIEIGQVAAIIYSNQVAYAVFLDECGINTLIGEASCATARLLGIDPDPKTGGTDGPVTYIVFTGASGRITDKKEYANHAKAVAIGVRRAKELVASHSQEK
jgi:hypothetical protein